MGDTKNKKSFWTTLPGIIVAITGLITATGGLLVILNQTRELAPSPTATAGVPYIAVSEPQKTVNCTNPAGEAFCRFAISGTAGGVPSFSDLRVYTFVFPVEPPGEGLYLQRPSASIESDGDWLQLPAYLGTGGFPATDGDTLFVRAALVRVDATYQSTELDKLAAVTVLEAIEDIEGLIAISDMVTLTVQR